MKTLRLKVFIISVLVTISAITGIGGFAVAQYSTSSSVSESPVSFQKEKWDISREIANIKLHRENIKYLKEKSKNDRAKGDEAAIIMNKKELSKALADLKREKAYLRADKMKLIDDYNLAISARKYEIKKDKSALNSAKRKLDKDLASGNETATAKSAIAVAQCQKELDHDIAILDKEKSKKNSDIVAINKEIKKSNGQFVGILYAENAVANTKNWIEK